MRRTRARVLIAGGGVAGLEAMLALHTLAGDLVELELLAPDPHFWYRPLAVAEPFGTGRAHRFDLGRIAESVGAAFTLGALTSVDSERHITRTSLGAEAPYDALVIACGAVPRPWLAGALTFRGPADTDAFGRLLAEAEDGGIGSIAFVAPPAGVWPLPLYELALQTSAYLTAHDAAVELTLVTPETEPLALFGNAAGTMVRKLLDDATIELHAGSYAARFDGRMLELVPERRLPVDRVVALPRLEAARILGIPQDDDGFIATDACGRVDGLPDVFAAGDITTFPIKQGGVAAQQADAVAEAIAAWAGASVRPHPFEPVLRGLLLTGGTAFYLRNEPTGGRGDTSVAATDALWSPPAKILGRYLAPALAEYGHGP